MRILNLIHTGVNMVERLLTPKQTGEIIQVTVDTLANSRHTGLGIQIPYIKLGKFVRYKESDIQAYIEANTFNHTGEAKEDV